MQNASNIFFSVDRIGNVNATGNTYLATKSGNVGIGTTTPGQKLVVAGNANISQNLTVNNSVLFVDGTSGNVGIGTATPAIKLSIADSISSGVNVQITANEPTLQLNSSASDGKAWEIISGKNAQASTGEFVILDRSNNAQVVRIQSGAGANGVPFIITSAGSVGIGTTTPGQKLSIRQASSGVTAVNISTLNGGMLLLDTDDIDGVFGYLQLYRGGVIKSYIGMDANNNTAILSSGAAASLSVTDAGNVGIGTTTPGSKLDVAGTINASTLTLGSRTATTGTIRLGNTSGIYFRNNADSVDIPGLVYDAPNTILIGETAGNLQNINIYGGIINITASPLRLKSGGSIYVDFNKDAAVSGCNAFQIRAQNSYAIKLSMNDDGMLGLNVTPTDTLHVVGTVRLNGGSSGTGLFVDKNSNVGIGTTSPAHKLTVAGNVNISGNITLGQSIYLAENQSLWQPVYGSDDDLVLYLPFNSPNGTTQFDRSPYGNDARLYNTTNCNATLGKYGAACKFDGVSAYISAVPSITTSDSFTVELWMKSDGSSNAQIWEGLSSAPSLEGSDSGYTFFMNNLNEISTGAITAGRWYYIVATYDNPSQVQELFVDGVSKGRNTGVASDAISTIYLASRLGTSRFFTGTIDEVRVYKRALSPEEVRTHYLRGNGFEASGAVTADKFRIINTSASKQLELNQTAFSITNTSGGDGLFYVDKSNQRVGIGTTSPQAPLEVYKNSAGSIEALRLSTVDASVGLDSGPYINFNLDNLAGGKELAYIKSGITQNGQGDRAYLSFWTRNNEQGAEVVRERVRITSTGQVGINDSTPSDTLTVNGTMNIRPRGTSALFVNPSGNVGIGTTSPGSVRLNITPTGDGSNDALYLGKSDNTNEGGQIEWQGAGSNPRWITDVFTGKFRFFVNTANADNTNQVQISNIGSGLAGLYVQGNVGIGTTSPGATLNVVGDVYHNLSTSDKTFQIVNGSGTSLMYVNSSSGNVGIGTASPMQTLTVVGTLNVTANAVDPYITFRNALGDGGITKIQTTSISIEALGTGKAANINIINSLGNFVMGRDSTTGGSLFGGAGTLANAVQIGDRTNNALQLFTNDIARVIISASGNVGIGTTVPLNTLHVNGTGFLVTNTTGTANVFVFNATTGNVGIGTTNPTAKLHINDSSASGALLITNVSGTPIFFVNGSSGVTKINGSVIVNDQALAISAAHNDFRLVLDDNTTTANLTLQKVTGNQININGAARTINTPPKLSAGSLSASTNYFVYAFYNESSGIVALEANTTGYNISDSGRPERINASTRRLVGMARTTPSTTWVSNTTSRLVASYDHRKPVKGKAALKATVDRTSTTMAEIDTSLRIESLTWADSAITLFYRGTGNAQGTSPIGSILTALTYDSVSPPSGTGVSFEGKTAGGNDIENIAFSRTYDSGELSEGNHTFMAYGASSNGLNVQWFEGGNIGDNVQEGIFWQ